MISLTHLNCKYAERTVLKDISLDIPSHLTILGANGSGKSTLAKAICGLISYSGEIVIDEYELHSLSLLERAKQLCYIPAHLEIYDTNITLFEFVLQSRYTHKTALFSFSKEDEQIAHDALYAVGLESFAQRGIATLSSGQTQLALIAQALTQQSNIIIFDEPTANLDPKNSYLIAHHIKKLKATHQVILITHDITLAHSMSSPVAFLDDGKLSYFEQDFFTQTNLEQLYGVSFDNLAVKYD